MGGHRPQSEKPEGKSNMAMFTAAQHPACDQGWKENVPRGMSFCCDDVIKEIYFYTKLSLSPFLKCKCNHATSLLKIPQGPQSFTTVVFKSIFPQHQNHLSNKT
jgi:hypothetical protein